MKLVPRWAKLASTLIILDLASIKPTKHGPKTRMVCCKSTENLSSSRKVCQGTSMVGEGPRKWWWVPHLLCVGHRCDRGKTKRGGLMSLNTMELNSIRFEHQSCRISTVSYSKKRSLKAQKTKLLHSILLTFFSQSCWLTLLQQITVKPFQKQTLKTLTKTKRTFLHLPRRAVLRTKDPPSPPREPAGNPPG